MARNNYRNIDLDDDLDDVEGIDDLQFTSSDSVMNTAVPTDGGSRSRSQLATSTATATAASPQADANYQIRQDESLLAILVKNSAHPFVCMAHVAGKAAAIALYILGGVFVGGSAGANFVVFTAVIMVVLAVDFYITQKISGRFLVGLRWHNVLEPDGIHTKWVFESREGLMQVNTFDRFIFWSTLYLNPVIWILFLLMNLIQLHLSWLIPCALASSLASANLYGFWRCSKDQQQRWQNMMLRGAQMGVNRAVSSTEGGPFMNGFLSNMVSILTRSDTTTTTNIHR
jgi:hypothetical protein